MERLLRRGRLRGQRIQYATIADTPEIPPLEIDAPSRTSVQLLFVPSLQDLQDVPDTFVRIELLDDRGMLAVADTPTLHHGVPIRGS